MTLVENMTRIFGLEKGLQTQDWADRQDLLYYVDHVWSFLEKEKIGKYILVEKCSEGREQVKLNEGRYTGRMDG